MPFYRKAILLVAGVAPGLASADLPETLLTSPLAELFGTPPTMENPSLSPDGSQIIFLQENADGIDRIYLLDLESSGLLPVTDGLPDDFSVDACQWAAETRLLCNLRDAESYLFRTAYYTVNSDGSDWQRTEPCGSEIDWLPEEPEWFLCGVARQSLYSRQYGDRIISNVPWNPILTDGHGVARLGVYRGTRQHWFGRADEDSRWRKIHISRWQRFEDPFRPVGFGENLAEVLHLASVDSGRWALFAMDFTIDQNERLVFSHPILDIEHVDTIGAYDRVVAVRFLDNGPVQHIIDERAGAIRDIAAAGLPGHRIEVIGESWDQNAYLVRARPERRAGSFHLVDARDASIELIGPEYAHLSETDLAETRTITFNGEDGGSIAGHLTLPPGRRGPVPFVLIPRATPSLEDVEDPHYLVEFLAASGYGVLRVEQRVPAEYGGGGWLPPRVIVGAAQAASDLAAATEYLVAEGIAAPGQFCAVGRDIGAYTLYMSALERPSMLRCIVGIRGISDPIAMRGMMSPRVDLYSHKFSPVKRADEIEPAVMLFDYRLNAQTQQFANALAGQDKDVTHVEYEYTPFDFDKAAHRIDMLARIDGFLDRNFPIQGD